MLKLVHPLLLLGVQGQFVDADSDIIFGGVAKTQLGADLREIRGFDKKRR